MDILNDLPAFLQAHAPEAVKYVLMGLGALVVMGVAYIKVTPSQDDDMWLQKLEGKAIIGHLLKLLIQFSPIERKEPKAEEKKSA